ncbi:hypothetical protein H2200_005043 [Cladophialophora chaetospira]|uniref:Uncharacterized protein n=1 Tax=Cladophialophora chaetospira TaxID=386627 RepID=A0AA38XBE7_9EURO|nr:hypothetical protein H2200_005043 [Cladophialophora chaetospira]
MPSLKLNFSTGSIKPAPSANGPQTTQQAALYKTLYRTPQGTILCEDVSSDARLRAIYAANAAPGQQIISYARASTNGTVVQRSPTDTTSMASQPNAYLNQPPSYVRPGTPLHQWASDRASQEQDHRREKVARHQQRQFRKHGGLQVALDARLQAHAVGTANRLDCQEPCFVRQKNDFKSGWKEVPTSPMPLAEESLGEEQPSKRIKLTCGATERAPPPAPMMAPPRQPTPLPRQKLVLSNRPPTPIRSLTPIPQPSEIRGCDAVDFQRDPIPMPLHARLAEPSIPKKLDEYYWESMRGLGGDYSDAFESWDTGMARTLPRYQESEERRAWFVTRFDGPDYTPEEESRKKKIDRQGRVNF